MGGVYLPELIGWRAAGVPFAVTRPESAALLAFGTLALASGSGAAGLPVGSVVAWPAVGSATSSLSPDFVSDIFGRIGREQPGVAPGAFGRGPWPSVVDKRDR